MRPTPEYPWPLLSEAIGAEVWVKHENCTPTGAFKVRGGLVLLERLAREEVPGVVSATTGNHGQSLAFAGRAYRVPVTIVAPSGNSPAKNAAMRGFGATLVEHGRDFQQAREYSEALAAEQGLRLVRPFEEDLVVGVATYAQELFETAGDLDAIFVPIGMGSGANAVVAVRNLLNLHTHVIGVVSQGAPATALSWQAGEPVSTATVDTFADGVACRTPDPLALEDLYDGLAEVVTVPDSALHPTMRRLWETTHHLPCPTGALATAALMAQRDRWQGKRVAVIMTSSNTDAHHAKAAFC